MLEQSLLSPPATVQWSCSLARGKLLLLSAIGIWELLLLQQSLILIYWQRDGDRKWGMLPQNVKWMTFTEICWAGKETDTEGWKSHDFHHIEVKSLFNMLPIVTWEENHVSNKPVALGGKDGKLNAGLVLLAVNWELTGLQIEITTSLDFELKAVRTLGLSTLGKGWVYFADKRSWTGALPHKGPVLLVGR